MHTSTIAQSVFRDSHFGAECELPRAGCALENAFAYDDSARELKALAERGLLEVVEERTRTFANETLIDRLTFKRLR